jgi:hypothetical protein
MSCRAAEVLPKQSSFNLFNGVAMEIEHSKKSTSMLFSLSSPLVTHPPLTMTNDPNSIQSSPRNEDKPGFVSRDEDTRGMLFV